MKTHFLPSTLSPDMLIPKIVGTAILPLLFLFVSSYVYGQAVDKIVLTNGSQLAGQVTGIECFKEKPLNLSIQIDKVQTDGGSARINVGDIDTLLLSQSSTPIVLSRTGTFSTVSFEAAKAIFNYFHGNGNRVLTLPAGISPGTLSSLNAVLVEICRSQENKGIWRGSANVSTAATIGTNIQKTLGGTLLLSHERNPAEDNWHHAITKLDLETSYGSSRKRGQAATVSTQWSYGKIEQDFALNKRVFLSPFGSLYHNFSTGMSLEQAAGVGLQYKVTEDFFIGGDLRYINEKLYAPSTKFASLAIGLSESYTFVIPNTPVILTERLEVVPAFKSARAIQARWVSFLMMPVTKRVNFTVEYDDDYMRNAPESYRQNFSKVSLGFGYNFNSAK